jgi:hypothetical protein
MRLPQSSRRPFSLLTVSLTIIAIFAALPLLSQRATAQLICSPPNLRFGGVAVNQSVTQFVILTNAGQASATISAVSASDSVYSVSGTNLPLTLTPGQSAALGVTFAPTAVGGIEGAVIFTNDTANASLTLPVVGSGFETDPVNASPANLSFGSVAVGKTSSLSVTLSNTRPWGKSITGFYVVGGAFSASGPKMPTMLGPGQSITLNISFSPKSSGMTAGSVFVNGPALSIPLNGTGTTATTTGQLNVSPVGLNFGSVDVGSTGKQTLTLSAVGGGVTVGSAASNNAEFSMPGASFPLIVNAGTSVQVDVAFAPTTSGTASGMLTFASNASNSQSNESLTGTGVAQQHSVNLSWQASTSSVAGYNVYRGTSVGNYSRINTNVDPSTAYTDNTVASGTTYYYAATAINASGEESSYSTPLKVSIP